MLSQITAQGQTIYYVLVDIASLPSNLRQVGLICPIFTWPFEPFSRSTGRATLRLLRDFDYRIFKMEHNQILLKEDKKIGNIKHRNGMRNRVTERVESKLQSSRERPLIPPSLEVKACSRTRSYRLPFPSIHTDN